MKSNLIGISGKINSGKDAIGQMIQLLTIPGYGDTRCPNYAFHFDKNTGESITNICNESTWKIVKFADKLKDIICLLIGCTREQLEDRDFKNKELPEDWWYYMAKGTYNSYIPYYTNLVIREKYFDLVKPTPRLLLQLMGTECGRRIIHPNIWVNATFADYKPYSKAVKDLGVGNGFEFEDEYPNWIITDVRFPNEVTSIQEKGGIVIRVDRPCKECGGTGYHKIDCGIGRIEHESETALDDYKGFDYTIINNKTLENLFEVVKNIIKWNNYLKKKNL